MVGPYESEGLGCLRGCPKGARTFEYPWDERDWEGRVNLVSWTFAD
jgi:hypothetical protein